MKVVFTRFIIGLMSGTSVDAIDAALVQITTKSPGHYRAKVLHHLEHPWPKKLRQRLLAIMAPATTTTQELCQLNTLVAHEFAAAVEQLLLASKTPREKITALGSHGQTICHLPPTKRRTGEPANRRKLHLADSPSPRFAGSTLQIGDPSTLATLTRIQTVGNFRPADIALGGQGAPLVPWTDAALLSHPTKTRCIQNIGGIANVTYLPSGQWSVVSGQKQFQVSSFEFRDQEKRASPHHLKPETRNSKLATDHWPLTTDHSPVLAFDTGPGNMLIDALISLATHGKKRYDHNGQLAARGALNPTLYKKLQSHPYFKLTPPKSTGREHFGEPFAKKILLETRNLKLETLLHTATRLTAWSIANAYAHFLPQLPDELILCGGGADNPTLVQMLTEELALLTSPQGTRSVSAGQSTPHQHGKSLVHNIDVTRIDAHGIPNKAKEAANFALLAAATLDRIPANLPSVTGASRPTILGVIAAAT